MDIDDIICLVVQIQDLDRQNEIYRRLDGLRVLWDQLAVIKAGG